MTDIISTADEAAEKFHLRDAGVQCCGTCRFFKQEHDADSAPDRGTCWHSRMQGSDDLHGGPLVYPKPTDICDLYCGMEPDAMLHGVIRVSCHDKDMVEGWLGAPHPPQDMLERTVMSWSTTFDDGVVAEVCVMQACDGHVWIEVSWIGYDGAQYDVGMEHDKLVGRYYDSCMKHELLVLPEDSDGQ